LTRIIGDLSMKARFCRQPRPDGMKPLPQIPAQLPARSCVARTKNSAKLAEANDALEAIRTGQVDALVVDGGDSERVFTLKSADHPYRIMVEQMTKVPRPFPRGIDPLQQPALWRNARIAAGTRHGRRRSATF
jgi:hypothetical protein